MFGEMTVRICKSGLPWLLTAVLYMMAAGTARAETAAEEPQELQQVQVSIGYRGTSTSDSPNRVKEYDSLESGPTLNLKYRGAGESTETSLDTHFLNENDYYLAFDLNLHSRLRLNLFNERLFHNLDHFPYDAEARPEGSYLGETQVSFEDHSPGKNYQLEVEQSEASLRYKTPGYPAHLNLKYWRWQKTGNRQLRFVDENCTSCHMQSRSRHIDQVTEEVTAGMDAHLGFIDLIFEQVLRTFRNRAATPVDRFAGNDLLAAGEYQHDETPDSRYTQSTLKAHSTLGGGFFANASVAVGIRENNSSLDDVSPVAAETDFRKLASDITYIPSSEWTFNLRYRRLDLDQSNVSAIGGAGYHEYADPATPRTFTVRNNIDLERSYYETSFSYRPIPSLALKGNYHREDIHRSDTDGPVQQSGSLKVIDPYWELPEDETIQKMRLTVSSRLLPKNALKLQGWYEFETSDDPAYSISIESGHTLFVSASYKHNPRWGASASFRLRNLENNGYKISQFDEMATPLSLEKNRTQIQQNASLGLWANLREGFTFDLNYGYLRSRIEQDLLYGNKPPLYSIKDRADYHQTVHTISVGTNLQLSERLDCRLEGYHIRSRAAYSPDFPTETLTPAGIASAADLKKISRIDFRQNGIKGRLNWQMAGQWLASLEMTLDDYDDQGSDLFDGSVETCMASLSRIW